MNRDRQKQLEIGNYHKYYPLSNISETLSLIEQECLPAHQHRANRNSTSTSMSQISFALGFITFLLCLAGVQLYLAVNLSPAQINNQTEKTLTFKTVDNSTVISQKKSN